MSADLNIEDDFPPADKKAWRDKTERDLKGAPLDGLVAHTLEGIDIAPLYAREDGKAPDFAGFPGAPPYVRGREAIERATRGWQVGQVYDHPSVVPCAEAIAADLERGATAVWLELGLARGTRVLTVGDVERLLAPVDLAKTPLYLDGGPDAVPVAAAVVAVARARGVDLAALTGALGWDPLGTLAREGTLSGGLGGAFRDLADLASWSREHTPGMRALLVSTMPYHRAGASAVQELAWAVATGLEYVRQLHARDIPVDDGARQVIFQMGVAGDFFLEIAKLRAARWLWSKAVAAWGGGAEAQAMVLHARTSPWTKSARDPWVNMLRATAESFAAAVGGADAIATSPFDEVLGPSDGFARRVARNTQLVLREEGHLHRVIDPAGGSWYLESITEDLARRAWAEVQVIEKAGGMARALARGDVLDAVESTADARVADISRRKAPFVGVSEYPNLGEAAVERGPGEPSDEAPIGRGLRDGDDGGRREKLQALADLTTGRRVVPEPGRIMAAVVEAAAVGVDLFSLGAVVRWGKPSRHVEPMPTWRGPEPWEQLRDASDAYLEAHGNRPRVFLANLGPIPEHRARADFAYNLFAAGGIEPVTNDGFESVDEAVKAFGESEAELAVICGPDARYAEVVPDLAARLKDEGASAVVLAGRPGEHEKAFTEAGVDRFVFLGADVRAILEELHRELGVMT